MKDLIILLILLIPLTIKANIADDLLERFFEQLLSQTDQISEIKLEQSILIIGNDSIEIEVDIVHGGLMSPEKGWYLDGNVKIKINQFFINELTNNCVGFGKEKIDAEEDLTKQWLKALGAPLSSYFLARKADFQWKNYSVYINEKGLNYEPFNEWMDGSIRMHQEILDQINHELALTSVDKKGFEKKYLSLEIKVCNCKIEEEGTEKVKIAFRKRTRLGGKHFPPGTAIQYLNWPSGEEYSFIRTYLLVKNKK